MTAPRVLIPEGRGLSLVFVRDPDLDAVDLVRIGGAGVDREDAGTGKRREVGGGSPLGRGLVEHGVSPTGVPMPADHRFAPRADALPPFVHSVFPACPVPIPEPPIALRRLARPRDPPVNENVVSDLKIVDQTEQISLQRRIVPRRRDIRAIIAREELFARVSRQRDERFVGPVVPIAHADILPKDTLGQKILVIAADQNLLFGGQPIDEIKTFERLVAPVEQVAEANENMIGVRGVEARALERRDHLVVKRMDVGDNETGLHGLPPFRVSKVPKPV